MYTKICNFFKENKLIIFFTIIFSIIVHFYRYSHEVTLPDSIFLSNDIYFMGTWDILLGRWGIIFFMILKQGLLIIPLIITTTFIILSIVNVFICKIFNISNKFIIIMVCAITSTFPTISESLIYTMSDLYALSLLFSIIPVYLLNFKVGFKYKVISVILLIISLSIYQAYIMVTISLCLITSLIMLLQGESSLKIVKKSSRELLIGIISVIIYLLISFILIKINNFHIPFYRNLNEINKYSILYNILNFKDLYDEFFDCLFKEKYIYNSFWHRNWFNAFILITIFINLIILIKKNNLYKKTNLIAILIILALIPIAFNLIDLFVPFSTYILTIFQYSFIYILSLKLIELNIDTKFNRVISYIVVILNILIIFTYIMSDNATYIYRNKVYKNFYTDCFLILNRIQNIEGYTPDKKVAIMGINRYTPNNNLNNMVNNIYDERPEVFENYFGIERTKAFFIKYFEYDMNLCSDEEYMHIYMSDEFKNMRVFPNQNSITIIDDIIVIKIEENPPLPERVY